MMKKERIEQLIIEGFSDKVKDITKFLDRLPGKYLNIVKSPIKIIKKINIKSVKDNLALERKLSDLLFKNNYNKQNLLSNDEEVFYCKCINNDKYNEISNFLSYTKIDTENYVVSSLLYFKDFNKYSNIFEMKINNVFAKIKEYINDFDKIVKEQIENYDTY